MPYTTEEYIDPEDDKRYRYFEAGAEDLERYLNNITRLQIDFSESYGLYTTSNSRGDCVDTYNEKATAMVAFLRATVIKYDIFLNDLRACIDNAKSLAIQYEISRHRTREKWEPDS